MASFFVASKTIRSIHEGARLWGYSFLSILHRGEAKTTTLLPPAVPPAEPLCHPGEGGWARVHALLTRIMFTEIVPIYWCAPVYRIEGTVHSPSIFMFIYLRPLHSS